MGRDGKTWAVVVAAGEGRRMRVGAEAPGPRKPFVDLAGRPVLLRTVEAIARCADVERTVVAVHADDLARAEDLLGPSRKSLRVAGVVAGGARRQDSTARALGSVPEEIDLVAVHDGGRPLVSPELFARTIAAARLTGAACAALPVAETLKRVDDAAGTGPVIRGTVDRSAHWAAQTPQVFRAKELRELLAGADRDGVTVTDETALFDMKGLPVAAVTGERANIKITTPEDLELAGALLASREGGRAGGRVRVGSGFDIHRLVPGRRLVLCGVEIGSDVGAEAHSDGDAAAHAVTDALLGACALGDIGRMFPDTDPAYKDADSLGLLSAALARVRGAGFEPVSLDVTILLERPKIAGFADEMRLRLAAAAGLAPGLVSVKAKTFERLGPIGEGRAVAAQATAVVEAPGGGA